MASVLILITLILDPVAGNNTTPQHGASVTSITVNWWSSQDIILPKWVYNRKRGAMKRKYEVVILDMVQEAAYWQHKRTLCLYQMSNFSVLYLGDLNILEGGKMIWMRQFCKTSVSEILKALESLSKTFFPREITEPGMTPSLATSSFTFMLMCQRWTLRQCTTIPQAPNYT